MDFTQSVISLAQSSRTNEFRPLRRRPRSTATLIAVAWAAAWLAPLPPARADLPPFAEEWATPALPQDVEVDPWGRVWVSCEDDSVHVYAATGGERLFAFGGTGTGDGQFQTPYGIAFDLAGDAYICDYAGARLERFSSDGTFLLGWSIPSSRADHVAIDENGDVYVTGYTDMSVHKYTATGIPLIDWTGPGGSANSGIVVTAGTVHVVQWDAPLVEQYTPDGTYLGSFGASTTNGTDIEVDALGQFWVCDFNGNAVRIFASDGTPVDALGVFGSGPGEFNGAIGVAIGLEGSIYVADYLNGRVQRFGDAVTATGAPSSWSSERPRVLSLAPNPCRNVCQITYSVPRDERLSIALVDVTGRIVTTLTDGPATAGVHQIRSVPVDREGRRLPAGAYFVRLASSSGVAAGRFVVVDP